MAVHMQRWVALVLGAEDGGVAGQAALRRTGRFMQKALALSCFVSQ